MESHSTVYDQIVSGLQAEKKHLTPTSRDTFIGQRRSDYWNDSGCIIRNQFEEVFQNRNIKSLLNLSSKNVTISYLNDSIQVPVSFEKQFESDHSELNIACLLGDNASWLSYQKLKDKLSVHSEKMSDSDRLLIGVELTQHPKIICNPFESKCFNKFALSHLEFVNHNLNTEIDITKFSVFTYYDPNGCHVSVNLISEQAQQYSCSNGEILIFSRWDPIHLGNIQKYTHASLSKLVFEAGLSVLDYVSNDDGSYAIYAIEKANW